MGIDIWVSVDAYREREESAAAIEAVSARPSGLSDEASRDGRAANLLAETLKSRVLATATAMGTAVKA